MFFKDKPKRLPQNGDRRERRRFAWRPEPVEGGKVWLETYVILEVFFQPVSGNPGWWSEEGRFRLEISP